ncbi:Sporulation kinase E [bioreactor metagenome]|uniref:Sporulation kinase E n=1 Tax=bioreactor metagenome TaxID=1076179 RepID=A0A644XLD2_9ZZZZ
MGQFLFEAPELDFFREQAKRYNFPEKAYLDAAAKVPIYSKEKLDAVMAYFRELAQVLAELGLRRLRQLELQTKVLEKNDLEILKVFSSTPNVAIQIFDLTGNITFWNNAAEVIYGYTSEEAVGRPVSQIFGEPDAEKIVSVIKDINISEKSYGPEEWILRDKAGNTKTVYSTIFPVKFFRGNEFVCMDVDITEKKMFEKELLRLDRLNLVGQMAASIGHEVRNPMTTVRGYLQFLQRKPDLKKYSEHLDIMIDELDRANDIIKEFLSLAKNKTIVKKLNNVNQIVNSIMPLIYADAIRNNITVDLKLSDIPDLILDEKEIRQLILNLVRNGFEAINENGKITIRTFSEDGEVVLAVQDNGSGIPEEIIGNVGTPFFTTKAQGTGLGLAVCYSIARRHQARIVIDSNSAGTTVFLKFGMRKDGPWLKA